MVSQAAKFVLQTGATVVLARLLTPSDYGLVAMVTAVTGFVGLFKDMGLSTATIQKREITHFQVSNLFWINVIVSFALALIVAACAPVVSWFYGEPRLILITLVLSGTFIVSGLAAQHYALLNRNMRFTTLACVEMTSAAIGATVGLIAAWYGARYWALVGMSVAGSLSYAVLVWNLSGWRPALPTRGTGILPMIRFGGHVTGFDMVNYFARNLDNILLGRFWGARSLGFYSRAYNMMMLPIGQIRGPLWVVANPAMSHMQNDPSRYERYYIRLVTMIAFITMPLMAFLFICADKVVHLLLGGQWLGIVSIFRVLCANAFVQPASTTWGLVLLSLGQSRRYLTWGVVNSVVIVLSFFVGLPWGAIGVATGYTVASYLLLVPTFCYCFRRTPVSVSSFFLAIWRPMTASLCLAAICHAFRSYFVGYSDIISIGLCAVIGGLAYLGVLMLLPGGLLLLHETFSLKSFLLSKETCK